MRKSRTSGSVGGKGSQLPLSTRLFVAALCFLLPASGSVLPDVHRKLIVSHPVFRPETCCNCQVNKFEVPL